MYGNKIWKNGLTGKQALFKNNISEEKTLYYIRYQCIKEFKILISYMYENTVWYMLYFGESNKKQMLVKKK